MRTLLAKAAALALWVVALALWVVALALWVVASTPSSAHAEPERWLFLPASDGALPADVDVESLVGAFEDDFKKDQSVVSNVDAATLFAGHSSEPVALSDDQLKRLQARLKQSAESLSVGESAAAEGILRELRTKPGDRQALSRDARSAHDLWELCLTQTNLMQRARRTSDAERQIRECIRWFPGFRLQERRAYPRALKLLLEAALSERTAAPHASLSVTSEPRQGCVVRFNGIDVGKTPLELTDLDLGPANIQLECDPATPGRVHALDLAKGSNRILIDPEFEAALRVEHTLSLGYSDDAQRTRRLKKDAEAVASVIGARRTVLLLTDVDSDRVRVTLSSSRDPARVITTISYAPLRGYERTAVRDAIAALRKAEAVVSTPPPERLVAAVLAPEPTGIESDSAPELHRDHKPRKMNGTRLALAMSTTAVGAIAVGTSWAFYAARRNATYLSPITVDQVSEFNARGTWALALGAGGNALLSVGAYFGTPQQTRGVPSWAWIAGGLGVGVGAVGLGFALFGEHCDLPTTTGRRSEAVPCTGFAADSVFGPLLMFHAMPLLSLPLFFALNAASKRPGTHADLQLTPDGISLRGSF